MKKNIRRLLAGGLAITTLIFSSVISFANEIDTEVINERWGKPTFIYGETLNNSQMEETKKLLGITNSDNINSSKVTYDDLLKYVGGDPNNRANMISSVLVTKEDPGKGVNVVIKTKENITQITEDQYANASITAGVKDATILVGAIRPVTGESALTGVYRAFEINGEILDDDRMEVAQDELSTVNEITQDNNNNENFSPEKLDNVITEVKNKLSEINKKQKESPSLDEIRQVIDEALIKYDLDKVITTKHIDKLINYFEKYVKTDAINSEEVTEQLNNIKDKIKDTADQIYREAESSGMLDKFSGFIREVYTNILNLFNKRQK